MQANSASMSIAERKPFKIVVLLSGSGTNFQAILDAKLHSAEVSLVVSNRPHAKGLERAQAAGVPSAIVDHKDYSTREAFEAALLARIDEVKPDLLVLAGFMRILTPSFITNFSRDIVNIHPSLLPNYRGLNTHQRAIDAGDTHAGVSVHFVTAELDGGPVIAHAKVAIHGDDTAESLAARVLEREHRLYPAVLQEIINGRVQFQRFAGRNNHDANMRGMGQDQSVDSNVAPSNGQSSPHREVALLDGNELPEQGYEFKE